MKKHLGIGEDKDEEEPKEEERKCSEEPVVNAQDEVEELKNEEPKCNEPKSGEHKPSEEEELYKMGQQTLADDSNDDDSKYLQPNEGNGADYARYRFYQTLQDLELRIPTGVILTCIKTSLNFISVFEVVGYFSNDSLSVVVSFTL